MAIWYVNSILYILNFSIFRTGETLNNILGHKQPIQIGLEF